VNRLVKIVLIFLIGVVLLFQSACRDKESPKETGNLWQAIEEAKELSIFENAIIVAGLQPLFEEQGPYTVFAPTNEAMLIFFEEFGFTEGLANLSPQDLQIVVLYHVVDDRLFLKNFDEELGYPTLFNGFEAFIARLNSDVSINGVSNVIVGDFEASNGVLHIVDHTFFIKASDGSIGIPGADGGGVGGNNPNRRGP
tara:strand:+ start:3069 stop:3659 length:591 start_codon:yes stop_codon:yes gene_type:complete